MTTVLQNSKYEIGNTKQIRTLNTPKSKPFDLEERTFLFARDVRSFCKLLPRIVTNLEDMKQVVRSSGSPGANYIEANEALTKKDFHHRLRIAKKEAKETIYWLRLVDTGDNAPLEARRAQLIAEATEIMNILGAILRKSQ